MYKYELHCHTSVGSKCGLSTPEEVVDFYKEAGYQGVAITDHFFNGNCTVPKNLPWEERVALYVKAYKDAKKHGDEVGMDVFFGFELSYSGGTDFLVYGLDEQWLLEHPYCDRFTATEFYTLAKKDGGYFIQAHPFREAGYIEMIRLFPRKVDAVETKNACRTDFENKMADQYADNYELPKTAGTDNHNCKTRARFAAVELEKRATDIKEIIESMLKGDCKLSLYDRSELVNE